MPIHKKLYAGWFIGTLCLLLLFAGLLWMTGVWSGGILLAAPPSRQDFGEFVAFCPYSHRGPHDPIVHPNMPGMSHSHDFFGNVTTGADSTLETLENGDTTCNPATDRSAYWVPTLFSERGDAIPVEQATFYYFVDVNDPAAIQPYPPGLAIVTGSATATTPPNPARFKWSCLGAPDSSTSDFVVCPVGSRLELLLNFPDCWDGVNLDSVDHQRHMAYSAAGSCPATHPVPVARLQFKLRYATRGEPGMTLSSGPAFTMHGDFFNAWEADALENRLHCLRNLIKCGPEGFPGDAPVVTPAATPTPTHLPTTPAATPAHPPAHRLFAPVIAGSAD